MNHSKGVENFLLYIDTCQMSWGRCYDHNFLRYLPIFGEKIAFFSKTNVMIQFLHNLALFFRQIFRQIFGQIFRQFFSAKIFKIFKKSWHRSWPTMHPEKVKGSNSSWIWEATAAKRKSDEKINKQPKDPRFAPRPGQLSKILRNVVSRRVSAVQRFENKIKKPKDPRLAPQQGDKMSLWKNRLKWCPTRFSSKFFWKKFPWKKLGPKI
jgi:hypothetical protein